ncbi:smoothelin, like isoform X2 [Sphaeramia orbicularis]|uniref:Smoothelin-like protein 2 n=1 Tax=Sphaeramia orbicularis TaxID=375764 RepID=A0A672Z0E6_9TELE|nr:smoothelin-like protein 2 isoform X2 [Sphaeramia orbicularis]
MEVPTLAEMGDLCHTRSSSPEGETVCVALSRYENTLQDAIKEIHVDISTFKLGMERRLEETANLSGPLGRAVAQLQQENRQLKSQLEALTQQVELLTGMTCDHSTLLNNHNQNNHSHKNHLKDIQENHQEIKEMIFGKGQAHTPSQGHLHIQTYSLGNQIQTYNGLSSQSNPTSPPAIFSSSSTSSSPPVGSRVSSMVTGPLSSSSPSTTRFSSRATFALSNKNSIEREEPIEVDPAPAHGLENGHSSVTEHSVLVHGKISPPSDFPHEHTAPVDMRMPHLPITATTKTAEIKDPDSPSSPSGSQLSPMSDSPPLIQSPVATNHVQTMLESPVQPVSSVKTWTPAPVKTLGSPHLQEKTNSASVKSVTYSAPPQYDRDGDITSDRPVGHGGERRRELVRSQTLPRNIGAQARHSIFEKLDPESSNSHSKPVDSKPKLKRSQSFGVSSASSIKQVLLEWCRSKTIGYQNIDIQNFSSSWSDGMAFCALVHSFFPTEFDYNSLSPVNRKHNFELAFGTADRVPLVCSRPGL